MNAIQRAKQAEELTTKYKRTLAQRLPTKMDELWYAYATATGFVNGVGDIYSPSKPIQKCKEMFPEIANAPKARTTFARYEIEQIDGLKFNLRWDGYQYVEEVTGQPWKTNTAKEIQDDGVLLNPETEEELLCDAIVKQKDAVERLSKRAFGDKLHRLVWKNK